MEGNVIYCTEYCWDVPVDPFSGVTTVYVDHGGLTEMDGRIVFEGSEATASVDIIDMNGKTLLKASGSGILEVWTETLTPGIYIAVAYSGGIPVARRKFTVK